MIDVTAHGLLPRRRVMTATPRMAPILFASSDAERARPLSRRLRWVGHRTVIVPREAALSSICGWIAPGLVLLDEIGMPTQSLLARIRPALKPDGPPVILLSDDPDGVDPRGCNATIVHEPSSVEQVVWLACERFRAMGPPMVGCAPRGDVL